MYVLYYTGGLLLADPALYALLLRSTGRDSEEEVDLRVHGDG